MRQCRLLCPALPRIPAPVPIGDAVSRCGGRSLDTEVHVTVLRLKEDKRQVIYSISQLVLDAGRCAENTGGLCGRTLVPASISDSANRQLDAYLS